MNELSDISQQIISSKKDLKVNAKNNISLAQLIDVGTSAGGARAKALVSINDKTGEIAYFVADAKNVYGYKINGDFKVTEKITSIEKNRKYKVLIGSSISNNSYRVFLTNKAHDSFTSIQFSFKDDKTTSKEFKIRSRETFIQTVNYNNRFYLISGAKEFNQLYVYTFDDEGNPKRNNLDISNLRFINSLGKTKNLLSILIDGGNIKKFEENIPNSIELTSEQRKMFVRDDVVLFTFDHHKMYTQVLQIDLNSFETFNVSNFLLI